MNSYKDITTKYLKENRGRTIITICGIILSIALMTAIMLFIRGVHGMFLQKEIDASGNYHVYYSDLTTEEYQKMTKSPGIEAFAIAKNMGIATFEKADYEVKLEGLEVSKGGEGLLPFGLLEGRYGENENEIAIGKNSILAMGKKIGDTINLDIDGKKKEYKIVGVIKEAILYDSEGTKCGSLLVSNPNITLEGGSVYFRGELKGLRSILNNLEKMSTKEFAENRYLLSYLGASNDIARNSAFFTMAAIIIGLVIVATVIVIRNSFYISIVSRIKEFGLLKAIGATSSQLKKMILKEAIIISGIAIPFGLFFGTVAIVVIDKVLKYMAGETDFLLNLVLNFDWWIYAIAIILGVVTTYISAFIPAREIKKITALEAIDSRTSIRKENLKIKKRKFAEKLLGIRNIMSYRNIKRNKKRYVATILALTVAMTISIVFTSYIKNMMSEVMAYGDDINTVVDISIYDNSNNKDNDKLKRLYEKLKAVNQTEVYLIPDTFGGNEAILKKEQIKVNEKEKIGYYGNDIIDFGNGYIDDYPVLQGFEFEENIINLLNKNLIAGKIDKEYIRENNGIILNNDILHHGETGKYKGSLYNLNIGDKIYIEKEDIYDEKLGKKIRSKENIEEFEIVAIVNGMNGLAEYREFITSTDVIAKNFNKKLEKSGLYDDYRIIIDIVSDDENYNIIRDEIKGITQAFGVNMQDIKELEENDRKFAAQLQFLVYGFIIVISLISLTNIFNTMATNILFRKQEIAALRAIGMSKKDVRNMIIKEGLLYGIISAIYSIIIGTIINYLLYKEMLAITIFDFIIHWEIIFVIILIAIIVGVLSSIAPLKKLNKGNIITDLKEDS
ncbi:MAG: ABC transporter permease [Sarcina sp.]